MKGQKLAKLFLLGGLLLTGLTSYAGDAIEVPDAQMVFKPYSYWDGHLYADIGAAYGWGFFNLSSPTSLGNSAIDQNMIIGGDLAIGYAFEKNYFLPIRIAAIFAPHTNKKYNSSMASFQSMQGLLNIYYDLYNLSFSGLVPYVGGGLAYSKNHTYYSIAADGVTYPATVVARATKAHIGWDIEGGISWPFTDKFSFVGFLRYSFLGNDNIPIVNPATAVSYGTLGSKAYGLDLGLVARYTFG